jgi:signal transduction histidine kinase
MAEPVINESPGLGWLQRPLLADAVLVVGLAAVSLVWGRAVFLGGKAPILFGAGWSAAVAAWWITTGMALGVLLLRRRFPVSVLLVTAGVVGYHMARGWAALPADAAAPIALFSVVVRRPRAVSMAAAVGGLVAVLGWTSYVDHVDAMPQKTAFRGSYGDSRTLSAYQKKLVVGKDGLLVGIGKSGMTPTGRLPPTAWGGFPVLALVIGLAWLAGQSSRHRHAHLAALAQRARDLERDRVREAELATAAERARISRELHDVVAHGLSVMVIQAQGGAAELTTRPEHTQDALEAIITTGRQSLAEMRRLLGVLRDPAGQDPQLEPQQGIADLPLLVARLREAGMPIDLDIDELPPALPVAVQVSAYRTVQEALTNVVKHAGPGASAVVRLRHEDDLLVIAVTDDGRGPAPTDGDGHGLRGMRERAKLLGGDLQAGPRPGGGFQIRVRLPMGLTTA